MPERLFKKIFSVLSSYRNAVQFAALVLMQTEITVSYLSKIIALSTVWWGKRKKCISLQYGMRRAISKIEYKVNGKDRPKRAAEFNSKFCVFRWKNLYLSDCVSNKRELKMAWGWKEQAMAELSKCRIRVRRHRRSIRYRRIDRLRCICRFFRHIRFNQHIGVPAIAGEAATAPAKSVAESSTPMIPLRFLFIYFVSSFPEPDLRLI